MHIDLNTTLTQIARQIVAGDLKRTYRETLKLQNQLIALIYDEEEFGRKQENFSQEQSAGTQTSEVVTLTIHEPLPAMKAMSGALNDHWQALIHSAIQQASQQESVPYFKKAMVEIEVITPRGRRNIDLWDTSNRAINLIINNLKGIYFKDDNLEHMAFSVVGKWGDEGKTVLRISEYLPLDLG